MRTSLIKVRSYVAGSPLGQDSDRITVRRTDADDLACKGDHAQETDSRTLISASPVARATVLILAAFQHELWRCPGIHDHVDVSIDVVEQRATIDLEH